jgi:hypothetical protein
MHLKGVPHCQGHVPGIDVTLVPPNRVAMPERIATKSRAFGLQLGAQGSPSRLPVQVGRNGVSRAIAGSQWWQLDWPALQQIPLLKLAIIAT